MADSGTAEAQLARAIAKKSRPQIRASTIHCRSNGSYRRFLLRARALAEAGVDFLLAETIPVLTSRRQRSPALKIYFRKPVAKLPVMLSVTIKGNGRILSNEPWRISGIPFRTRNFLCRHQLQSGRASRGAVHRRLSRLAKVPVSSSQRRIAECFRRLRETPDEIAVILGGLAKRGCVDIVGGCCGTTPAHIRAIRDAVRGISHATIDLLGRPKKSLLSNPRTRKFLSLPRIVARELARKARSGRIRCTGAAPSIMAPFSSAHDIARFGSEVVASPKQSDVSWFWARSTKDGAGSQQISIRCGAEMGDLDGRLRHLRGFYRAYHVDAGIDEIIPVDVYFPVARRYPKRCSTPSSNSRNRSPRHSPFLRTSSAADPTAHPEKTHRRRARTRRRALVRSSRRSRNSTVRSRKRSREFPDDLIGMREFRAIFRSP